MRTSNLKAEGVFVFMSSTGKLLANTLGLAVFVGQGDFAQMLDYCWASVTDSGREFKRHR